MAVWAGKILGRRSCMLKAALADLEAAYDSSLAKARKGAVEIVERALSVPFSLPCFGWSFLWLGALQAREWLCRARPTYAKWLS